MRGCIQVTDDLMYKITLGCTSLQFLDISCIPKITNKSIQNVTGRCKKLAKFHFEQCMQITGHVDIVSEVSISYVRLCITRYKSIGQMRMGGSCKITSLKISAPLESADMSDCFPQLKHIAWVRFLGRNTLTRYRLILNKLSSH